MTPTTGFAEEKSYVCAINEVYECVTVTGCSRVSLQDANVAGIMVLDMEKKQLRSAPLGGEPRVDDIEGLSVTNKAILIHGTGKRETDRTVSALISLETGNLTAWYINLRLVDFTVGKLLSPTLNAGCAHRCELCSLGCRQNAPNHCANGDSLLEHTLHDCGRTDAMRFLL